MIAYAMETMDAAEIFNGSELSADVPCQPGYEFPAVACSSVRGSGLGNLTSAYAHPRHKWTRRKWTYANPTYEIPIPSLSVVEWVGYLHSGSGCVPHFIVII
jgi:hypothetical protein